MDVFVYLLVWIGLSTWAISLVSRHVEGFGLRVALYILAVVLPVLGFNNSPGVDLIELQNDSVFQFDRFVCSDIFEQFV